jgi:hypothetical protein
VLLRSFYKLVFVSLVVKHHANQIPVLLTCLDTVYSAQSDFTCHPFGITGSRLTTVFSLLYLVFLAVWCVINASMYFKPVSHLIWQEQTVLPYQRKTGP